MGDTAGVGEWLALLVSEGDILEKTGAQGIVSRTPGDQELDTSVSL